MKKGEIFGQIFVYIIAIIIVAFLLVFGYRAISTFKEKADQVAMVQFKNEMQKAIETISLDYGSVKVKEFMLPEDVKKVCFVTSHPGLPQLRNTGYRSILLPS